MKRIVLILLPLLPGCAMGPDFQAPAPVASPDYMQGGAPASATADGLTQSFTTDEPAPSGDWWREFYSAPLDDLIDTALRHSPTLAAASARLLAARENYRAEAGTLWYPAVDASLSASRQRVDLGAFGIQSIPQPGPFTLYDAAVRVSYTFDVFGAGRRSLEALAAGVNYQAFQLRAARLSLAANVVTAAIRRASLEQQLTLSAQLLEVQAQQLRIAQARQAAGGLAATRVREFAVALAQARGALPPLEAQLAREEHLLAVLTGTEPAQAGLEDMPLASFHLPGQVALDIPSELAHRRPDIRAAEALLHEASARVGVATADLYPRFTLSGSAGSERMRVDDIVKGLNVWDLGLGVAQPLFHGGELRARRRAAQADYQAALSDYRLAVLQGLQQVADALRQLVSTTRALREQADTEQFAADNLQAAQARQAAGGISESELLDARGQLLRARLDHTRGQAQRLIDTAALFQSLGEAAPGPAFP